MDSKKNTKKILLFHMGNEKIQLIQSVCKELNITVLCISPSEYTQSLGFLAGIEGFRKNTPAMPSEELTKGFTNELTEDMLLFCGIPSDEMDVFLAGCKKRQIPPTPLKAIITPHNIFWTANMLFHELCKERQSLQRDKQPD